MNVHPSHDAPSQKDACIDKETNTLLSMPSQKGLDIENSSQPGAQYTGDYTKSKQITPYVRKKKGKKAPKALGEHKQALPKTISFDNVPISSTLDASQENAEMQPHSFSIYPSHTHSSSQISPDVFMIDNMEI